MVVGSVVMCAVLGCLWFVSSFAFVVDGFGFFVAGGSVFFEEFVLVVSEVCCVDDLVEVFSGFFSLLVLVRVRPVVSEVVRSAVRGIDHKCCFEQFFFRRKVRRVGPHV